MAQYMQFDSRDKAALRALDDDFSISGNGEIATVSGSMQIELVRLADDNGARLRLTIRFPNDEEFTIFLSRAQTLKQLGVGEDEDV